MWQVENSLSTVMDEDWDILIVLDACRYDIFKDNYRDFLHGELEKRFSPSVDTPTWLKSTFTEYYKDIIYISGNPYINSKNIDLSKVGFNGLEHFYKIVDVWDFGFSKILRTVHSITMNKSFLEYYTLYPEKRFIVHYIQPHYPYVSVEPKYIKAQRNMLAKTGGKRSFDKLMRFFPHSVRWKTAKLLRNMGVKVRLGVEEIYLDKGWEGIRNAYIGDLRFVLKFVSHIVEKVKGKIVVTADHDKRLGEGGWFGHGGKRCKEIVEIPWLVIEK